MTMVHIASLSDMESLPKTKWNIPQPLESEEREDCLKTGGLDLILAPGLAFTRDCWRLGRGKGYYDNFLNLYGTKFSHPYTIGLALRQCIVDHIPTTPNDVQLDEVISSE
jgi:5-formyltetrahydrofolate cyclo-ligase